MTYVSLLIITVSLKKSLKDYVESEPHPIDEVPIGTLVPGFVSRIEEYGVFVRFVGGLTALCPKKVRFPHRFSIARHLISRRYKKLDETPLAVASSSSASLCEDDIFPLDCVVVAINVSSP